MKREVPTKIYNMASPSTVSCLLVEPIFTGMRFICFGISVPLVRHSAQRERQHTHTHTHTHKHKHTLRGPSGDR